MNQITSSTYTDGNIVSITGVCRVGRSGSKIHFATNQVTTWENGKKTTLIQPGAGCVTSDRQRNKAYGFQPFGIVTCTSCYQEGLEILKA